MNDNTKTKASNRKLKLNTETIRQLNRPATSQMMGTTTVSNSFSAGCGSETCC